MADTTVKYFTSEMVSSTVMNNTEGKWIELFDACLVNGFGQKTVDSIVVADGVATVTVTTGHSAIPFSVVLISGATPSTLNGEKKVISASTTTFTFDATGVTDQTATGTITMKMPGAGWVKPFSGTNLAAYQSTNPTSTKIYFRIDDTSPYQGVVSGCLTMTDIATFTGQFGQGYFPRGYSSYSNNRKWWLAANDSFVIMGIDAYGYYGSYNLLAFGDIIPRKPNDPYRFLVAGTLNPWNNGDMTDSVNAFICNTTNYSNYTHCSLARSYSGIGGGVQVSPVSMISHKNHMHSGYAPLIPFPNGGDNSLIINETFIQEMESNALRGKVPGLYVSPQAVRTSFSHDFVVTVPELPNKKLFWKTIGPATGYPGGVAIDMTGPWV